MVSFWDYVLVCRLKIILLLKYIRRVDTQLRLASPAERYGRFLASHIKKARQSHVRGNLENP